MIANLPNVPLPQASNAITVNAEHYDADAASILKEVAVRRLINGSIKANEDMGVLTGVRIYDVGRDRIITDHKKNVEHFAASINKLPVALFVVEDIKAGRLSLDQQMTWQPSDVRGGFGDFDQPGAPLQASLQEVLEDMLNKSGNTAVRIMVNGALGGAAAVNERMAATGKLPHTYLQPVDSNRFFLGFTTAQDSMWVMKQLMKAKGQAADVARDAMETNIFADFGVRKELPGTEFVVLINKVGILDDEVDGNNRHDVGIIKNVKNGRKYVYSFLTTSPYTDAAATSRAEDSLEEMGGTLLDYAGRKKHGYGGFETFDVRKATPAPEKKILY